ncbi:MAG: bifunctional folylpolyglutamate synthase/dihydrofolate synthase [Firmicutes bacterium]|nr:bifunctional folylpolyglutamate synthase/dihydrofolate synthase [Bacillota bacterium]
MDYEEMLARLESLGRFGIRLTLERMTALMDLLGHPERSLRVVHVAGTNGKGSTVAMLDAILRAAGIRTGRWTSPHLEDFRERLVVDGEPVPPEALAAAFTRVWAAVEKIKDSPAGHPTQFEVATATAFLALAEARPEIAVIEVGLGGRYDATNVVAPLVAVITPLALDHTERLGPDLAAIAREKAGIIKPGVTVVSAPQEDEAMAVVTAEAARHRVRLRKVGEDFFFQPVAAGEEGTFVRLRGAHDYGLVRVNLLGGHQAVNAAVAVAAAEALAEETGLVIPPAAVHRGLDGVAWPGRLEVISRTPLVVLDGAHNPHGLLALRRAVGEVFRRERADFLFGSLANRPLPAMAAILAPVARRVVAAPVEGGTAPGVDPLTVREAFSSLGVPAVAAADPEEALSSALAALPPDGLLCVCGSLYLVGAVRHLCRSRFVSLKLGAE